MAWEDAMVLPSDEEELDRWGLWPEAAEGAQDDRPPAPDWLVGMEYVQDLQEPFMDFFGIPKEEPFTSIVLGWAAMRREGLALAQKIQADARAVEAKAGRH